MLQNAGSKCGSKNPPGTRTKLYYALDSEFNGWPRTRAEITGASAVLGDKKILDEPFDFTTAPSGQGNWKSADILVDTGEVRDVLEGELGGQGYKSSFGFFLAGTDAENLEVADDFAAASGCIVAMIADRLDNFRVLGTPDNPAMVETAEGSTGAKNGDRRGFAYTFSASTGETAPIYDAETHGIDITPN